MNNRSVSLLAIALPAEEWITPGRFQTSGANSESIIWLSCAPCFVFSFGGWKPVEGEGEVAYDAVMTHVD